MAKLGDPTVYSEPFAGSLAVLLTRPIDTGKREIVCDTDGMICNFWRSVVQEPEDVVYWCDYPTIHQDLTARHTWLRHWSSTNAHRLSEDPSYCDAQAAGWWVWGASLWIGKGWCQRDSDTIPKCAGGEGVSEQRLTLPWAEKGEHRTDGLLRWFTVLQERLTRVIVLNRSWQAGVATSVLSQPQSHQTGRRKPWSVGVFLDPPYRTATGRTHNLYVQDTPEASEDVALASFVWAIEHGDAYRIAYACRDGDFHLPTGWEAIYRNFPRGYQRREKRDKQDMVMFSPACLSAN